MFGYQWDLINIIIQVLVTHLFTISPLKVGMFLVPVLLASPDLTVRVSWFQTHALIPHVVTMKPVYEPGVAGQPALKDMLVRHAESCMCDPGYTGRRCRLRENFCIPNPCQNNATCVSHHNNPTFSCQCLSGFVGERCEIRECHLQPCANGGTCQSLNSTGVRCMCPAGYQGDRCMETVNDNCADSPCLNGGTCTSLESGFECTCPRGYKGQKCRKRTNPCKPNPRQNGGKCRTQDDAPYGHIRCVCRAGYLEPLCEHSE